MTHACVRRWPERASAALLLLLLTLAAGATEPARDGQARQPTPNAQQAPAQPRCVHGCLRWGKVCNVDPRGVYRCQRRCEKFGEICE